LDNEIKPSINYVVTLPLDLDIAFTSTMVRTKSISVKPPDTEAERLIQVVGTVHTAGHPTKFVPGATVVAKEAGVTCVTDAGGKYFFPKISEGRHTFQILVSGKKMREIVVTVPGQSYDLEV
jgi:hypothetical protein